MRANVLIIVLTISLLSILVFAFLVTPLRRHVAKKYRVAGLLAAVSISLVFIISPLRGYVGMKIDALLGFLAFLLNMRANILITALIICLLFALVFTFLLTPLRRHVVKNYQVFTLLAIASVVLEFLVSPLRGYIGMPIDALAGFFVFLLATWYFLKKFGQQIPQYQIVSFTFLGLFLLAGSIHVLYFQETLISFPDFLIHVLGIFAGYFLYNHKSILNKVNLSVSVLIVLFTYFYGYSLWMNNLDFGSYTSEVHYRGPAKIILTDKNANDFTVKKGKITVLDFWFVGCGACINDFPEFQKLYTNYKNNPGIQFLSVNQPYPRDKEVDRFSYLTNAGFSFPMAATKDTSLITSFQISVYPTVIILDEEGDVVFKGDIRNAASKVKELL